MSATKYTYAMQDVNIDRLTVDINQNPTIVTGLDHIDQFGSSVHIWFKAALPQAEDVAL